MKNILIKIIMCLIFATAPALCQDFADSVTKPVDESIAIRKKTWANQDNWAGQREKLIAEYEALSAELKYLLVREKDLESELARQKEAVAGLERKKIETARMSAELEPSLAHIVERLKALVDNGLPFLVKERQDRAAGLARAMDDSETGLSEKFRKVFEALLIEAGYGNSAVVSREMIVVQGKEILADVLRLGRLSLFFQTLDQSTTGFYDPVSALWKKGPARFNREIAKAVEIAAKRRPSDIVSLPLGKVVKP